MGREDLGIENGIMEKGIGLGLTGNSSRVARVCGAGAVEGVVIVVSEFGGVVKGVARPKFANVDEPALLSMFQ